MAGGALTQRALYRAGGRLPQRYLLSGLLKCGTCGANLIHANKNEYQCSAYRDGHACKNGVRLKREELEQKLLHERILKLLESPEQVRLAAKELEAAYRAHMQQQKRAATEPS